MIGTPQLLITDDDRDFRETLRSVFEPRGFATMLAADGEEAVHIVRRQKIHVVLIDFHMPKLTGPEAIQQIKEVRATLPCILISAAGDEELQRQTDAFCVLRKPVSRHEITHIVKEAMISFYGWVGSEST